MGLYLDYLGAGVEEILLWRLWVWTLGLLLVFRRASLVQKVPGDIQCSCEDRYY